MAAIRKRKRAGRDVYLVDWYGADGVRHRLTAKTREQAEVMRAERVAEASKGGFSPANPDLTLGEYAAGWLASLENSELKPRTITSYKELYRLHIAAPLGPIRLADLRRVHVKDFLAAKHKEVIKRYKKETTLSRNTVRLIRATLSMLLADAFDAELIRSNPAAQPSRRRGSKKGSGASPAIRPFSDQELAKVLESARLHEPEHYPLFLTLARTGMRPGEAAALLWDDIDFNKRKILIERAYSRGVLGSTKTGATRTVDMSTELAAALAALYRVREAQTLKHKWGEVPDLVFVNSARGPLDESKVRKVFKRVMKKAGISGHVVYDLRHTFASLHLAANHPLLWVSAQLGHAKPSTTLQWYARWLPQADAGFVDRLDSKTSWAPMGTDDAVPASPGAA